MRARAADGIMEINGARYSYRSVQRAGRVNPIDVDSSEGITGDPDGTAAPGYGSTLPDVRKSEFTVSQAMYVDEQSPYSAPINLVEGGYYELAWFPAGLTGPGAVGVYLCVETGEQGTVGQGALIVNSRWRSDGLYTNPGEV